MWSGSTLNRSTLFAERRGPSVRLRRQDNGEWRTSLTSLSSFDSMVTHCADPGDGLELLLMRERMRNWRFYDNLRTDMDAPARQMQVPTWTPVLAGDGGDLAAAVATIQAIGDGAAFAAAVEDAFPGAQVRVDDFRLGMRQHGLLRPLSVSELSEGTLRYLLLIAALLSPRPPELMILNEPESSLHPSLLGALARLLLKAAEHCQIVLVSHSERLIAGLRQDDRVNAFELEKDFGETIIRGGPAPRWAWPAR